MLIVALYTERSLNDLFSVLAFIVEFAGGLLMLGNSLLLGVTLIPESRASRTLRQVIGRVLSRLWSVVGYILVIGLALSGVGQVEVPMKALLSFGFTLAGRRFSDQLNQYLSAVTTLIVVTYAGPALARPLNWFASTRIGRSTFGEPMLMALRVATNPSAVRFACYSLLALLYIVQAALELGGMPAITVSSFGSSGTELTRILITYLAIDRAVSNHAQDETMTSMLSVPDPNLMIRNSRGAR